MLPGNRFFARLLAVVAAVALLAVVGVAAVPGLADRSASPPGGPAVASTSPAADPPVASGGSPGGAANRASGAGTGRTLVTRASIIGCAPSAPAAAATPAARPLAPAAPVAAAASGRWANPSLVERVPVLMYHRVVAFTQAGDSLPSLVVPPPLFDGQMSALQAAGWHAITLRQLAIDLAAGRREPPRTFVPTFDDGYRDGFLDAFPILKRHGFVGTFFVIAGRVGMSAYLAPSDLCAMTRAGDEIANHTVHHVALGAVSAAVANTEVRTAGRMIEGWTGVAPITLAYPFGSHTATAMQVVGQAGYALAATTVPGAFESYWDRLAIPRVRVGPGTSPAALVATLSAYGG